MITAAIHALVVQGGQCAQRSKRGRPGKNALDVISVQADTLPLPLGQGGCLLPDGGGDARATQLLDQSRPPEKSSHRRQVNCINAPLRLPGLPRRWSVSVCSWT